MITWEEALARNDPKPPRKGWQRRGVLVLALGVLLAIVLAAIGLAGLSSGPSAQDVQACRMAVTALDSSVNSGDYQAASRDYLTASTIAVSPDLQTALSAMSTGTLANDYDLANESIRLAGAICTKDGVAWPEGDM